MEPVMRNRYIVFSSLTEDRGHLLLDDEFWFRNLRALNYRPRVFSSTHSVANLAPYASGEPDTLVAFPNFSALSKVSYRLNLVAKSLWSPRIRDSKVIVQGFDEMAILPFLARARLGRNQIGLVLTNNISKERFDRNGPALRRLLRIIFRFSDRIFYHSDFELELIRRYVSLDAAILRKLSKLKYHLLGNKHLRVTSQEKSESIVFFGPVMDSKPWRAIIDLIKADTLHQYVYRFFNMQAHYQAEIRSCLGDRRSVEFISGYRDHAAYIRSICSAKYVFLPHNELFEGKLSGILCDAIACETPVISDRIEPVLEFSREYGHIGHIHSYSTDCNWPNAFLRASADPFGYECLRAAMRRIQTSHSERAIINEFVQAF